MRTRRPLRNGGAVSIAVLLLHLLGRGIASAEECPHFVEASEGLPTKAEWRSYPVLADLNADGHIDIAAHPRKGRMPGVWFGDGEGRWSRVEEGLGFPFSPCGVGVDAADVNGDGHLDLGIADHCSGLFVYFGDGQGGWRLAPLIDHVERSGREDLAFGDIDGDTLVDIVAIATSRGGLQFYRGDGQGNWTREERGLPKEGKGKSVALGDLNGDGRLDIAAAFRHRPIDSPVVWVSNSEGYFEPASTNLPKDGKLRVVEVGDVNGDEHLDLVASTIYEVGRPPLLVYLGDGGKSWELSVEGLPGPLSMDDPQAFYGVYLGDFNADGHSDLVGNDWARTGVRLWLGDGSGKWAECRGTGLPVPAEEHPGQFGYGLAVGDVNGDGKQDLVMTTGLAPEGSLRVWLQE